MSGPTRIVFMGTPEFAVPSLQALLGHAGAHGWQLVAVATQPDRRAGRGKKLVAGPVKELASSHHVEILQPASLRKEPETVDRLEALAPDLLVVAAYGLLLPKRVLEIPTFGSINVHASLLPAYRGASPISAALLDGLQETGVSIMLMDEGLDTGPVLSQRRCPIAVDDTTGSLSDKLAQVGAEQLLETLPAWLAGTLVATDQARLPGEISHCRLIAKQDGAIDWTQPATRIERMTRAYDPWPSAFTQSAGRNLRILAAEVIAGNAAPGEVLATERGPAIGTGDGLLLLRMVQPAGKRPMDARSFVNGAPEFVGSRLGEVA